jgi:hypothetical protein
MRLAVEVPETGHLAVVDASCTCHSTAEVDQFVGRCVRLEGVERLADACLLAERLMQPSFLRSEVPGLAVETVQVIVVPPHGGAMSGAPSPAPDNGVFH